MADKIESKLETISNQRTAKVKQIKTLQAKLRKAGTDAEAKKINEEIKSLNAERTKIEQEYNDLSKLRKTAKEYTSLNKSLTNLNKSLVSAEARGEDTESIKSKINKTKSRINIIGPTVESNFPELKPSTITPSASIAPPAISKSTQSTKLDTSIDSKKQIVPDTSLDKKTTGNASYTINPLTGKKIKTSDIKPAVPGAVNPNVAVGPNAVDTTGDRMAAGLNAAAESSLDLAGTLFEHVDSLKAILKQYTDPKLGWTNTRFLQELRNDPWFKKNSKEIIARYTQLYNYQDLVATGQADGTTNYEKEIRTLKDQIIKKAREMGSGLASDPAAIQRAAENMYITNTGIDDALTTNILAAAIRPIGGQIAGKPTSGYSGQALQDYQTIQAAAKSNGFSVADIIPGGSNEQQVLQGIASGSLDVNRIVQDARKLAAQGQPQYVRDLLGQGYNLDQVYQPYRQTMANILEIGDPNQIDLNDPTLRMAITDKGDMNLYDFKKALRQDNRWQYTAQAKDDVSTAALNVLRDFGFQG
jgi:hypothetical protein